MWAAGAYSGGYDGGGGDSICNCGGDSGSGGVVSDDNGNDDGDGNGDGNGSNDDDDDYDNNRDDDNAGCYYLIPYHIPDKFYIAVTVFTRWPPT